VSTNDVTRVLLIVWHSFKNCSVWHVSLCASSKFPGQSEINKTHGPQ